MNKSNESNNNSQLNPKSLPENKSTEEGSIWNKIKHFFSDDVVVPAKDASVVVPEQSPVDDTIEEAQSSNQLKEEHQPPVQAFPGRSASDALIQIDAPDAKKELTLEEIEKMKAAEAGAAEDDGGYSDLIFISYGMPIREDSVPRNLQIDWGFQNVEKITWPVFPDNELIIDNPVLITDLTPALLGGDVVVDEDDLPERGPNESIGSDPTKESTTVQGDFKISAPDGVAILSVGGENIIVNDIFTAKTIVTPLGNILELTNFDAGTGTITYLYTLKDNETHPQGNGENDIFEDFSVFLKDKDGDSANDTLFVRIIDDIPTIALSQKDQILTVDESDFLQDATANFSNLFITIPGADGGKVHYELGVKLNGENSGLVDTQSNQAVFLFLEQGNIIGRVGGENGEIVFTISLNPNTGDITLDQSRAVVHDDTNDPDESSSPAMLLSADLVTLKADITDGDGDKASAIRDIGNAFRFEDDGPSIDVRVCGPADKMIVDESDFTQNATANFADNFVSTSNYGADGAGSIKSDYQLSIVANGVDSGLDDVATGNSILLKMNGSVVEGYVEGTNDLAFTVTVDASGIVTLDGIRALTHPDGTNPDDGVTLSSANLVLLTRTDTITDKDGDKALDPATIKIGHALVFKDDGPSIEVKAIASPDQMTVDESDFTQNATGNFADNFSVTSNYGADNAGSIKSDYSLSISANNVDSGLDDVATGKSVLLKMNGGVVEGYVEGTADLAFTVTVDASGVVTLDGIRALTHPDGLNPDDSVTLSSANLIALTRTDTIIDKDTDKAAGSAIINIGQALIFKDDGPSISVKVVAPADLMTVDESDFSKNATGNFADNFSVTSNYGADNAGSIKSDYKLSISANGVDSGLDDVATGKSVLLTLNNGVVEGHVEGSNELVFTVSVDASGVVTLDGIRALTHPDGTNPDDSVTLSSANLIALTRTDTITDKDGDKALGSAAINIGQALNFKDDGPSISVKTVGTPALLTVDESDFAINAKGDFSVNFVNTPNYGADQAGSISSDYKLSLSGNADSGLDDVATGKNILLTLNNGVVEGHVEGSNELAFTVSVDANGIVTLDGIRALVHPNASNPDDSVNLSDKVVLTRSDTIIDKDGDKALGSAALNIGQALIFKDDGPSISVKVEAPADLMTVDESDFSKNATGNFADNFSVTSNYGADNAGSIKSDYSLSISASAVDSGLDDVATGKSVLLKMNGGVVEGYVEGTADLAFTVTVNASGVVTLDGIRALTHPDGLNPDDSVTLSSANLIALTRTDTITDKDGDKAIGPATIDIGQALIFKDDGPSISVKVVAPADLMTVDESDFSKNATGNFADNFSVTSNYGADNAGSIKSDYSLSISANNVDSGLDDVATGKSVLLKMNGGVVEGYVEGTADLAFTVTVNASGVVTLDGIRALTHPDGLNPDDSVTLSSANLIALTRTDTITDKDGDKAIGPATIDIGQALIFKDDGPSIEVKASASPDQMTVDESNFAQNATGNFADNFSVTSKFGADNAGTLTTDYKLSISANNADSGLDDVATGKNVLLTLNNGVVEGRVQGSNELVFTVSVNATGVVSLDGIRAVVHPNASNPDDSVSLNADTLVKLTRTDTIIDKDGDSATSLATLNIGQALIFKDDGPVAVDDCFTVSAPPLPSYNLTFVLDVSGSMNTVIGNTGKTRLDLLQEALTSNGALLDSYQAASTALKITIVTFSGDTDGQNADDANTSIEFTNIQAAKNYIDALSANGWTNYRAATEAAKADIIADNNNPSLAGYIDRLYFLSDGKPEPQGANGIDNRLTDAEELAWRNLLNADNVEAFILNIGSITPSDVDEHLRDLDDDQPGTVITVAPDLSNLQQILVDTISQAETTGNVLTNDNAGADQGALVINVYFTLATAQAATAYLAAHPELVGASVNGATVTIPVPNVDIVTPIGNKLHIEADGDFKYTNNFGPNAGQDEEFHYTMKDKDGDTATAELCFDIDGTVKISDLTPKAQGGDVVVDEDDLLSSRGVNESAGSDPTKESTNIPGTFKINAPDGVGSLKIADQTVISNDVFTARDITSPLGNVLHILSYDALTGTISYSFELKDNETHALGSGENDLYEDFTIALKDADVTDPETATDVLTVRIIDDVPSITVTSNGAVDSLTVDETILTQNASANFAHNFSVTSIPGADGATQSSKYVLTLSANGVDSGVDDVATGQNVMLFLNNGVIEGRTQNSNQIVFTVSVDAAGTVTLDQIRALIHPNSSDPNDSVTLSNDNLIKLTRTDTILDSDGDSASSSATLNIGKAFIFRDDAPTAVQDTYVITPPPKPSYNLTFILDVSGSMNTKIGNTGKTRLDLLQEALTNNGALLDSYQAASTALKISIITFSGDLDGQNADDATISQEFSSIAAAKTYIDNLSANGWTNYRAAIQDATADVTQDSNNPSLAGYIDRVYFLSDGKPQPNPLDDPGYSIDNRLTDAEESAWRTLLNTNNVEAFILNIGSFSQADIDEHLRDLDDDQPGTVITVAPDLSNLQQILVSTINQAETTGNVLTNDAGGADSSKQLVNISFTMSSSQAAINYLSAHPELVGATRAGSVVTIPVQNVDIITPVGNKLHIDANGAFTYSSSNYAQDDVISYTMKDKDGDTSSATMLFDLNGNASLLSAGQSVDGPIVDATIFQDENSNTKLDANESVTLSGPEGAYNLMIFDANKDGFIDSLDGRLVSIGGTDTATGLSYQMPLFAPVNSSIISPFTSLLEMQIEGNKDPKVVNDQLVKALGLTPGVDLTKLNPFISASHGEEQSLVQAAAIMTMSIQLGMALSQLLGVDQAQFAEDIYKTIGDQVLKSSDKVDFSSVTLIHSVVEEVSTQLNVNPSTLNPIVDMMKASQEAIQMSSHDIIDPVMAISDVQSITQGAFAHAITDFYSGIISQNILDAMINTLPQNVNPIDEHHNDSSGATADVAQEHVQLTNGNILQDSQSEQHNIVGYKYVNEANQVVEAEFGVSVTTKSGAMLTIHQDGSYSISPSHPGESFMEVIEYTSVNKLGEQFENYLCLHTADIKPDYSQVADLFHQGDDNYLVDISHIESNLKISMQDIDTHHSALEQLHDANFSNTSATAENSSQVAPSSPAPLSATVIVEQITAPTAVPHPLEQHTPNQTHE